MRSFLLLFTALPCLVQAQTLTNFTTDDGLASNVVLAISAAEDNGVVCGTQEGLMHYNGTTWLIYTSDDGLVDNTVFTVLFASDGIIWAGTDFGISSYNGTDFTTYTTDDGLEDNRIKTIFEDSQGIMWFGNNDGVSSFDGTTFTNYTTDDGLPFGGVSHVTEDNDGHMWFGTGLGGVFELIDGTLTSFSASEGLISNSVRSVTVDSQNRVWVGTGEGIQVLNQDHEIVDEHLSLIVLPEPHVINPVEDLDLDSNGRMWVGVYVDYLVTVGGVAVYDNGTWWEFNTDDGLISPAVNAIAVTADDACWVATAEGITRISDVPLSVESSPRAQAWPLYPNPCQSHFTVAAAGAGLVQLCTLAGQLVLEAPLTSGSNRIDVASLPAGCYTVRTEASAQVLVVQ